MLKSRLREPGQCIQQTADRKVEDTPGMGVSLWIDPMGMAGMDSVLNAEDPSSAVRHGRGRQSPGHCRHSTVHPPITSPQQVYLPHPGRKEGLGLRRKE